MGGTRRRTAVRRTRRSGSRVGRAIIGKADNLWAGNNETIGGISPDVEPFVTIVHSRQGGELAGGWRVSASVLHVDLTVEVIF